MSQHPPDRKPEPDQSKWVDKIARRSAGLGDDNGPIQRPANDDAAESRRLWRLAGLGLELGATVGIFAYGGHWLDQTYGWGTKATITAVVVATIGGIYLFIKQAIRANR